MDEMTERSSFRVVMIGDSAVGKTSLINMFLGNPFDKDEGATIGALFHSFEMDHEGRRVEIQMWDTAGQEQYRSLCPVYFRSASAAVIVFDVAKRSSFNSLGDWMDCFRDITGDSTTTIVVGNKCDMRERMVETTEARAWAESKLCEYIETSAKSGQGVRLLFQTLVAAVADTQMSPQTNLWVGGQQRSEETSCC